MGGGKLVWWLCWVGCYKLKMWIVVCMFELGLYVYWGCVVKGGIWC